MFNMDTMDVDCHPCASKQGAEGEIRARREQGLGRADRRGENEQLVSPRLAWRPF